MPPTQGMLNATSRKDFYVPKNIIGYTGSLQNSPTVYRDPEFAARLSKKRIIAIERQDGRNSMGGHNPGHQPAEVLVPA